MLHVEEGNRQYNLVNRNDKLFYLKCNRIDRILLEKQLGN